MMDGNTLRNEICSDALGGVTCSGTPTCHTVERLLRGSPMQDCNTREHCAMASPSPQDIRRASRNASIRDLESRQGVRLDGSTVSAESPLHLRLPQPQNVLLGNRQ